MPRTKKIKTAPYYIFTSVGPVYADVPENLPPTEHITSYDYRHMMLISRAEYVGLLWTKADHLRQRADQIRDQFPPTPIESNDQTAIAPARHPKRASKKLARKVSRILRKKTK